LTFRSRSSTFGMKFLTDLAAAWLPLLLALGWLPAHASSDGGQTGESFAEELFLKPLANGQVLAYAQFTTVSGDPDTDDDRKIRHFDLMPKVVGEFVDDHGLHELRLALTRGVWRAKDQHPIQAAPTGALVQAVFDDSRSESLVGSVDAKWRRLTNALSGQFCASLNFLDSGAVTSRPEWILGPMGVDPPVTFNGTLRQRGNLRYGVLPGENVCTENLTPWKKLLPCGGKRGIGALLNARSIHRTSYHSIGLTMRRVCPQNQDGCSNPRIELNQHITLIFDPTTFPENANKVTSHSGVKLNGNGWSIRSLFGIGVNSRCPMAQDSTIFVATSPDVETVLRLDPKATRPLLDYKDDKVHVYDVEELLADGKYNIIGHYSSEGSDLEAPLPTPTPTISANRYQTGHGQEVGGIVTQILNSDSQAVTIVFYDVLPWYLRVYFHTLKIEARLSHNRVRNLVPIRSKFVPGLDRTAPYTLELVVTLPPKSTTKISVDFEHSILKWNEYPPDANKGFYVGSALVSTLLRPGQTQGLALDQHYTTLGDQVANYDPTDEDALVLVQLYTESLLISLPTPDFSMPYNVICLACTVVALAFGPLLNLTTKTLQVEEIPEAPPGGQKSKLPPPIVAILQKIPILNRKFLPQTQSGPSESSDKDLDDDGVDREALPDETKKDR